MSITFDPMNLPNQQGSKNAAITLLSVSDFTRLELPPPPNQGKGTTIARTGFALKGSDGPGSQLFVQQIVQPKGIDSSTGALTPNVRSSLRLVVMTTATDSVTGEVTTFPVEALVAWNVPSSVKGIPTELISRVIQACAGLALGTFDGTSGAPDADLVANLAYGTTTDLD